jgi:hypothetical protein
VALERWQERDNELRAMLLLARSFRGAGQEAEGVSVNLKKGERVYLIGPGAALIEPRRQRGHYQGGYSGFSFRVMKGVSYRVGGMRGTNLPGPETPTAIDSGTVTITNQRVVFMGTKQTREWAYSKLIGIEHHSDQPWTALAVSNRQKVSGILYDWESADTVRFKLSLALAVFNEAADQLIKDIEREFAQHSVQRPQLGLPG